MTSSRAGNVPTFRDAEAAYSKGTKAELERNFDRAFLLYFKAAEDFLHLSRATTNPSMRTSYKSQADKALERAEKIKRFKRDIAPVARSHFDDREQSTVLRKSSTINGSLFPLWEDFSPLSPISQPAFSPVQQRHSSSWRRLSEAGWILFASSDPLQAEEIVQSVVSDCSVCASIAVCIDYDRRWDTQLCQSPLHPQDLEGRYSLRLLFNGAPRRIDIDDQLPSDPDGNLLCMSSGSKKQLLPSLIEKGYMRLMGGYDFPGSNSNIDLHALIGWIPEIVEIHSSHFEREKTWRRIFDGFKLGQCMLTLGTGEILPASSAGFPKHLLPAHCYAVIGVSETDEDRVMTILDSWVQLNEDEDRLGIQFDKLAIGERCMRHAKAFELDWDTICNTFDGIYLSWNPEIHDNHLTFQGMWNKSPQAVRDQPRHFQLALKATSDSFRGDHEVWVLLTRHVIDTKRSSEFISLYAESADIFDTNATHLKGAYTSSTHVLVKGSISQLSPVLNLVASYDGEVSEVGFTISVFASIPISWVEDMASLPFKEKVIGSFTSKTAGGNPLLPTFMNNPQYHLHFLPEGSAGLSNRGKKAQVKIVAQGERDIPLNVGIVWSNGHRVTEMVAGDIAASSGPYTYAFAQLTKDIQLGEYVIVVSAFGPQNIGPFTLDIESSHRFELNPVPQEGAGMFSKVIRGSWSGSSAAGGPSFKKYTLNPIYELKTQVQCQVKARLQLQEWHKAASINVTLFRLGEENKLGAHISTSGPYSDVVCGVITPQVTLQPGTYLIIPSTFNPGIEESFRLIVYTSAPATITPVSLAPH